MGAEVKKPAAKHKSQKDTLRKVLHYIRRYWFFLGLSLILAAVTVVLTLYVPVLTGEAVE